MRKNAQDQQRTNTEAIRKKKRRILGTSTIGCRASVILFFGNIFLSKSRIAVKVGKCIS